MDSKTPQPLLTHLYATRNDRHGTIGEYSSLSNIDKIRKGSDNLANGNVSIIRKDGRQHGSTEFTILVSYMLSIDFHSYQCERREGIRYTV